MALSLCSYVSILVTFIRLAYYDNAAEALQMKWDCKHFLIQKNSILLPAWLCLNKPVASHTRIWLLCVRYLKFSSTIILLLNQPYLNDNLMIRYSTMLFKPRTTTVNESLQVIYNHITNPPRIAVIVSMQPRSRIISLAKCSAASAAHFPLSIRSATSNTRNVLTWRGEWTNCYHMLQDAAQCRGYIRKKKTTDKAC